MMERTTRTHTGKTPIPGMASAINPGKIAQRRPKIRKTVMPFPGQSPTGGVEDSVHMETTSETAATRKARACTLREGR